MLGRQNNEQKMMLELAREKCEFTINFTKKPNQEELCENITKGFWPKNR